MMNILFDATPPGLPRSASPELMMFCAKPLVLTTRVTMRNSAGRIGRAELDVCLKFTIFSWEQPRPVAARAVTRVVDGFRIRLSYRTITPWEMP